MRILEVRHAAIPLDAAVANAAVRFDRHTVSLVVVVTDQVRGGRPVHGVGFNSIGRFDQAGILDARVLPRLRAAPPGSLLGDDGLLDPAAVQRTALLDEKPGGHGDRAGAVAAVELAVWDALAKLADEPAYATIARRLGGPPVRDPLVATYAAGGYYPPDGDGRDPCAALTDELLGHLDRGYTSVKIKVGGASRAVDLRRIEAAVAAVGDPARIAVDANGRFGPDEAVGWARALAPYGLRWFEEPCDPLDFEALSGVVDAFGGTVATGENLFSRPDVVNLLRYAGLRPGRDVFQMDAGLSYGLTGYTAILDAMRGHGMSPDQAVPHGGHLVNLHIVAGLGLGACESYPGVFAPFGGFGTEATLVGGRIRPPDAPGFGLETKPDLAAHIDRLTDVRQGSDRRDSNMSRQRHDRHDEPGG